MEIAEDHLEREQAYLCRANRFLFTDTNAITTYMYALCYHKKANPRLSELAVQAESRYDVVFVCDTDIPYDDTGDRSGDANRCVFQKQILGDLSLRKIPFFVLRGDLETRVQYVKNVLGRYHKYALYSDTLEQIYYLVACTYCWWRWAGSQTGKGQITDVRFSAARGVFIAIAVTIVFSIADGYLMSRVHLFAPKLFPEQASYPYLDVL